MAEFLYTVWFENPRMEIGDQDREWPACMIIIGESAEDAHRWGDHLSRSYALRREEKFLSSGVESVRGEEPSLPRVRVGVEESDEVIGW